MQRIRKQSNYLKNKPSDLPVYLDDTVDGEIDVTTVVEPAHHQELKPMNIGMDDMEYADDFEFQDFDNAQDYQEFTRYRRYQEGLRHDFQAYPPAEYYEGVEVDNPEEVDLGELYPEGEHVEKIQNPVEKINKPPLPVKKRYVAPPEEKNLDPIEKEKRKKERLAARARARYQSMSEEQRRKHNQRRRVRQLGINPDTATAEDVAEAKRRMSDFYAKKAEQQRIRYHQLSDEQKREHNRKRSEAGRRRRQQEDNILYANEGEETPEQQELAQQIILKTAKKAEAARLRYARMTPEERKEFNARRAAATRKRRLGYDPEENSVQAYPQEPSEFNGASSAGPSASDNQQVFDDNNGQGTSQDTGDDYYDE
ncbi:hypothetical protein CAEBREN_11917 [Caenorhabditis brenneri]|uniref:Uncharacterized protein n=1 Tax=Caenorhabditis brenneri TaxID=135651 RepID=G0MN92_CAEBE|nr:hypothetical protein CAEBREN_11917 [Caenorhabditis brenneri]